MKASIYLFQFRFDIRYRFDKRHVIFDVFFKLSTNRFFLNDDENLKLKSYHFNITDFFVNDQCFVYHDVLISMFSNFHKQLIDDYVKKNVNRFNYYAYQFKQAIKAKEIRCDWWNFRQFFVICRQQFVVC